MSTHTGSTHTGSTHHQGPLDQGARQPLAGVLVVAMEQAVSAPMCTRHLAEMGARVIKVEPVGRGDFTRDYDEVVRGLAAHFVWANRGKESLTLNVKSARGNELLHRLLSRADVLVSNLGPGARDRLGLNAATLTERYPRLIVAAISGYGDGGTLDHKRAYDLLVQAEAGSCAITGWEGQPAKPGVPVADVGSALYAYSTILAALYDRERTGRGAAISVSLFDTVVEFMGYALNHSLHSGHDQPPNGLSSPAVSPYGAYPTADGQTVVLGTTNDGEWHRMAVEMLGDPDLAANSRYARNTGRIAHRLELDKIIGEWCLQRNLADIQRSADAAGIGNARYNTPTDVLNHPHLADRGRWRDVDSPAGPIPALLPPPVVDGWELAMGAIPGLGEHTDSILTELGLDDAEVAGLRRDGVV
ncbi:MAG: CaiB/BaiF CoA transferase family protein [Pseudonocardia sp.]